MSPRIPTLLLALQLLSVALAAQPAPAGEPAAGALPFAELAIFARQDLTTEINLEGAFLKLIANATANDDPEFARLVSGLQAIRVQIAPLKGPLKDAPKESNTEKVRGRIEQTVRWLEAKGWTAVVRSREKGEESYIYIKEVKGEVAGLVVLSFEPGNEAAVINIVGRLDPAQMGRLGSRLHLPHLDTMPPKTTDKPRDPKRPG